MSYYITFLLCLLGVVGAQKDLTRQAGSKGADVVEAVVDLIQSNCIFSDDRLFLRRLAYVESRDGEDSTYNNGNSGGIWMVTNSQFASISTGMSLRNEILTKLSVDWSSVTYGDLAKPLYSALAASLVIKQLSYSGVMASSKVNQGEFWAKTWRQETNSYQIQQQTNYFVTEVDNIPLPTCTKAVDLVTVVDESGSVGASNFEVMKSFLVKLVDRLTIGPDAFRVGAVKFKSSASEEFPLDMSDSKDEIKAALGSMIFSSGGTDISRGIVEAQDTFINSGRKSATRAMLLLTDGKSNIRTTSAAAADARANHSIVIFPLGIGNIDFDELNAAASEPNCTHLFVIDSFSEIDSILYQIIKSTCSVKKPVDLGSSDSGKVEVAVGLSDQEVEDTLEITPGLEAITSVEVAVICGVVDLYASIDSTKPNEAFYTVKGHASDGKPAVLQITNEGKKVYVTYKGKRVVSDICQNHKGAFNITILAGKPTASVLEVVCRENGVERTCTEEDLAQTCGSSHIVLSPEGGESGSDSSSGSGSSGSGSGTGSGNSGSGTGSGNSHCPTPLETDVVNPCNSANFDFHFIYPKDNAHFIQCDEWGNACVMPCEPGSKWNDHVKTCTRTLESCSDGIHEFPSDKTKYKECHGGRVFVRVCSHGLEFNPIRKFCDWPIQTRGHEATGHDLNEVLLRLLKKKAGADSR